MRHDHHCHAAVRKLLHNVENLSDHFGVERGGRLVEQHDFGIHRESADYSDTLLLTARKLLRVTVRFIAKTYSVKQLERFFFGIRF